MVWNFLLPNKRQKLRLLIKWETLQKDDVFKEKVIKSQKYSTTQNTKGEMNHKSSSFWIKNS